MTSNNIVKTLVKICGITRTDDTESAFRQGADFAGIIVGIEQSPRCISPESAKTIVDKSAIPVVLLIDTPSESTQELADFINPYAIQFVGECKPDDIEKLKKMDKCLLWKTLHIPVKSESTACIAQLIDRIRHYQNAGIDTVVLDTMVKGKKGGTGVKCDWETARSVIENSEAKIFLAGGLKPSNIYDALTTVRPSGVDISSGVELKPGIKEPEKISRLMNTIRLFDNENSKIQEV